MVTCGKFCSKRCCFCAHCIYEKFVDSDTGESFDCEPIGCKLHPENDIEYGAGCCYDFHCILAKKKKGDATV